MEFWIQSEIQSLECPKEFRNQSEIQSFEFPMEFGMQSEIQSCEFPIEFGIKSEIQALEFPIECSIASKFNRKFNRVNFRLKFESDLQFLSDCHKYIYIYILDPDDP